MGRITWAALVLSVGLVGCKGGGKKQAPDVAAKPAATGPRIPSGPVPVTLPKLPPRQAREVASATAFVTIAKDGKIALGPLAPGATPYAGTTADVERSLEDQVFDAKAVAAVDDPPQPGVKPDPNSVQDDPPPPEEEDVPDDGEEESGGTGTAMALEEGKMGKKDSDRAEGQYKMKKTEDDEQLARQQAIEAARAAGVLGSTALKQGGGFASITGTGGITDVDNIYGGLLGNELGEITIVVHGVFEEIGTLDALVLADDGATASSLVDVLAQLDRRRTSIAVEGAGAPDAVKYRFGAPTADAKPELAVTIQLGADALSLTPAAGTEASIPYTGPSVNRDALLAALRATPSMRVVGAATIAIHEHTTVQQLVDVLGALGAAGATEVLIVAAGTMNGGFGFGRDGFGPGGGGTGWGTIGTGRYGTIGRGAGTGNGYGVGGGNGGLHTGAPQVRIGQPNAAGDLDKAIIRRYIKRNIQKITYCYEKQLLADPKLEGTVTAQFFISPEGHVTSSTASGVDPEVASCLAEVIKAIEFPKPKGGGGVQVNYPFTFKPAS